MCNLTYFPDAEIMHVKGHQDAHKTRLSWIETLNVRADAIATKTRFESRKLTYDKQCVWHPKYAVQLYLNNLPVHKWMLTSVHQAATSDSLINYIQMKLHWTHHTYKEVDWELKRQLSKNIPEHMQSWTTKLGTN